MIVFFGRVWRKVIVFLGGKSDRFFGEEKK